MESKMSKISIFYIPNALFWDKMQRYLFGTFKML